MKTINPQKKNTNVGCFGVILGTLAVIVCVAIFAVISSLICNLVVSAKLGSEVACSVMTMSMTVIVSAFILFEAVFIFFGIARAKKNSSDGKFYKKLLKIIVPSCIGLALILSFVSANTYTKLSENSISKVFFGEYKTYSWTERNDVMRYHLSCDENGKLSYTVTMKDGEKIEILGSVTSCSDEFAQKYKNMYGYAAYLSESFAESEFIIEGKVTGVEHMESFYKDSDPETWKYLEAIINTTIDDTVE